MNEEPTHKQSMAPLDSSTRLAYERTYLAHERTLMGWVRTAIALISFGFTIAKVFEYLREKGASGRRFLALGLWASS
jgi:putative membrane protein